MLQQRDPSYRHMQLSKGEKYREYNQWFIDRKIGGPQYDKYMEDAIRNENNNQKLLEKLGARFQVK